MQKFAKQTNAQDSLPTHRDPQSRLFPLLPSRLTRYILVEILKIFIVSLIALTLLILMVGVGRELLRRGLGMMSVVQLLPYIVPISLQFAFPATALFSICCVYGRMAADGEVSTVKASGISPLKLLQPAFVFALVLSPIAVGVSDLAVSWGRPGISRVVLMSVEDVAYRVLRRDHSFTSDHGFSIHVQGVEGDRLINPTVTVHNQGGEGPMKLSAREGILKLDAETYNLVLRVTDSQLETGRGLEGIVPGETEFKIPLANAMQEKTSAEQTPSWLPLRLIRSERMQQDARTHAFSGQLAAHVGFSLLSARPEEITGAAGRQIEALVDFSQKRLTKLHVEPWRRWAEGFSCFFFVFVGAPLAMIAKTSDYWTTFGLCFLPILLAYYPLFIFGLEQAKNAGIPPYGVWIGNIALVAIGTTLIARVRRY